MNIPYNFYREEILTETKKAFNEMLLKIKICGVKHIFYTRDESSFWLFLHMGDGMAFTHQVLFSIDIKKSRHDIYPYFIDLFKAKIIKSKFFEELFDISQSTVSTDLKRHLSLTDEEILDLIPETTAERVSKQITEWICTGTAFLTKEEEIKEAILTFYTPGKATKTKVIKLKHGKAIHICKDKLFEVILIQNGEVKKVQRFN